MHTQLPPRALTPAVDFLPHLPMNQTESRTTQQIGRLSNLRGGEGKTVSR